MVYPPLTFSGDYYRISLEKDGAAKVEQKRPIKVLETVNLMALKSFHKFIRSRMFGCKQMIREGNGR